MTTPDDYEDMTDPHWFTRAVFNRAADLYEEQAAAEQRRRAAERATEAAASAAGALPGHGVEGRTP